MLSSSTVTLHMYVASHVEMGSNGDERRAGHGKLIPIWSLGKPAALDLTVTSSELKFVLAFDHQHTGIVFYSKGNTGPTQLIAVGVICCISFMPSCHALFE
eukprot:Em0009g1148a